MPGQDPQEIVREVIEAHGGARLWNGLEALEAEISARGLLFTMKRQPVLDHVLVRAATREPRFTFLDIPGPGLRGQLIGDDEVRIADENGKVLARRAQPRALFRGLRRLFTWDSLDFIYFAGYATWNYLLTPFLFLHDGFTFETVPLLPGMPESWAGLRATFPKNIPTHCRRQNFYFDRDRRLRRLDYTAEVVGGWAHAAHLCEGYRSFNGFMAPTRRRVKPLFFGSKPLPGPTLVALDIHDIRLIHAHE